MLQCMPCRHTSSTAAIGNLRRAIDAYLYTRCHSQEAERDREMVSAIVSAIEAEEQEEAAHMMKKREETRRMVRGAELQRARQVELRQKRQVCAGAAL